MPEGPSILYLKKQLLRFKGKVVRKAGGYGPMPTQWMNGKRLVNILTWGKHLLLVFAEGTVKLHLGLFGEVLVNEKKGVNRSFFLEIGRNSINCYVVRADRLKAAPNRIYDWRTDILNDKFSETYVKELLIKKAAQQIGDVLMNQKVFTGVGNIIRNEALYHAGIHPESTTGKIPVEKITELINEVIKYARVFYHTLEQEEKLSFSVYHQEHAPDGSEVTVRETGISKRKVYFSEHTQVLYK